MFMAVMVLTLVISISRRERPFLVLTVNLISWAFATLWQWELTMGFDTYGGFAVIFYVIPSLIVILISCSVYWRYYYNKIEPDEGRCERPVEKPIKTARRLLIWTLCILAAFIITDFTTFLDLLGEFG